MNSLFTKMGALVLALALCFAAVSLANAETEYPPRPERSSADLAGVLGEWVGRGPADVLICLMDVPSGALCVSGMVLPERISSALLAGMCGFGGLCVIAQSLGALRGSGISAGEYVGIRAVAGLLCAGYMALLQGLPHIDNMRLIEPVRENPLAAGALIASILAVPILLRTIKSIS